MIIHEKSEKSHFWTVFTQLVIPLFPIYWVSWIILLPAGVVDLSRWGTESFWILNITSASVIAKGEFPLPPVSFWDLLNNFFLILLDVLNPVRS